jgi:hypothetical protein
VEFKNIDYAKMYIWEGSNFSGSISSHKLLHVLVEKIEKDHRKLFCVKAFRISWKAQRSVEVNYLINVSRY